MADKIKTSQSNINYSIGGKSFSGEEISTALSENPIKTASPSNVRTDSGTTVPPQNPVHDSVKTAGSVQTPSSDRSPFAAPKTPQSEKQSAQEHSEQQAETNKDQSGQNASPARPHGEDKGTASTSANGSQTNGVFRYRSMTNQQLNDAAFKIRVEQGAYKGGRLGDISQSVKLEGKASLYESVAKYRSKPVSLSRNVGDLVTSGGRMLAGSSQAVLSGRGDLGDDMASGAIAAGGMAIEGYRIAQKASDVLINTTVDVAKTAQKLNVCVADTAKFAKTNFVSFNSSLSKAHFEHLAKRTGLLNTETSKTIINTVNKVDRTVDTVGKIAKGSIDVVKTAVKLNVCVADTAKFAKTNFVSFNSSLSKAHFEHLAKRTGLLNTATSKTIINTVNKVDRTVDTVGKAARSAASTVKNVGVAASRTAVKTVKVVRGVVTGKASFVVVSHKAVMHLQGAGRSAALSALQGARRAAPYIGRGVNYAARKAVGGAVKAGVWTKHKGIPKLGKLAGNAVPAIGGLLSNSDDMMVSGIGNAVTMTTYTIKTATVTTKVAGRAIKTTAKAGIKTAKTTVKAVKFARQNGLKAAWKKGLKKIGSAMKQAGKSAASALLNLVKGLGKKALVPLLLIIVGVVCISSVVSTPAVAVGGIFSGSFDSNNGDGTYTEKDVREYITDNTAGIPALRSEYINDLYYDIRGQLKFYGGSYDFVRFKTNKSNDIISWTIDGISQVFYTEEELTNIIQPLFNAILLKDYDLSPTDAQAERALKSIFESLFRRDYEDITEYCGQDGTTGLGTPLPPHDCGFIHALGDCPNVSVGVHGAFSCSSCCYYYCEGHLRCDGHLACDGHPACDGHWECPGHSYCPGHEDANGNVTYCDGCEVETCDGCEEYYCDGCYTTYCDPGCYTWYCDPGCVTWYHSPGCKFACAGYRYCGSHKVCVVTLNMDGIYQMLAKYFTDPIDVLLNRANRTDEQEQELATLQDSYEICLEMIAQVNELYGGGLKLEDLSAVSWVSGTRTDCNEVAELALSQIGQAGGQQYWSYCGFEKRVAWDGCFAKWVIDNSGYGDLYAQCSNNTDCIKAAKWFKDEDRLEPGGFTDLAVGDIIFFDWEGNNKADHMGIVIGRDDTYVYTVEGNSGNVVRILQYELSSSVIYGYGLMNY